MAKDNFDTLKDIAAVFRALVKLGEQHPYLATVILAAFLLLILEQSRDTLRKMWAYIRMNRRNLIVGCVGLVVLLVVSWFLIHSFVKAQSPRPTPREPPPSAITWSHRVLLQWAAPNQEQSWRRFEVEARQGDKRERYEANRSQFPMRPIEAGFEEGVFEWRVRARDPESRWSAWQSATFYKDRLTRIRKDKMLRIGLFADELPPFAFYSASSADNVDGAEVEVARLLGRELAKLQGWPSDLRVEIVRNEWLVGNVEDLKTGKVDLVIGNTARSKKREAKFNIVFSKHYLTTRLTFVWMKSNKLGSWTELADKKVATWEGSTAHSVVAALRAAPRNYRSTTQMFAALDRGEIDAILDDEYVIKCEMDNASVDRYETQVFVLPEDMQLEFDYPEKIAAYVYNDGSSTALLDGLNTVLESNEILQEIKRIVDLYANSPGGKGT
jgi:ABC-type amino acid transport substrate-binding protein